MSEFVGKVVGPLVVVPIVAGPFPVVVVFVDVVDCVPDCRRLSGVPPDTVLVLGEFDVVAVEFTEPSTPEPVVVNELVEATPPSDATSPPLRPVSVPVSENPSLMTANGSNPVAPSPKEGSIHASELVPGEVDVIGPMGVSDDRSSVDSNAFSEVVAPVAVLGIGDMTAELLFPKTAPAKF